MALRCLLVVWVALMGAAVPLMCMPLLLGADGDGPQQPWPVLVGEDGFRSLLIANSANDSDAFVDGLNGTLSNLTAAINNRSVSDTSAEAALERAVNQYNRENGERDELERIREDRIYTIKYQILGFLGFMGGVPTMNATDKEQMETMRELYSQMRDMPEWPPSDLYSEKVQSFYPSCVRPKNTDEELWNDPDVMHLYFDLKYPEPQEGVTSDIITAKLRLHKISQDAKLWHDENCNTVSPPPETTEEDVTSATYHPVEDEIRVSVYYYTRSLKKNRGKKKLLDSRVLAARHEEWTEFDVGAAAKSWKESGKNHGLVVQVEGERGQPAPTRDHFTPMDCTNEASATARPIPGFLVASRNNILQRNKHSAPADEDLPDTSAAGQYNALYLNTFMFPMMDLCTVEIPQQEAVDSALRHLDDDLALSTTPRASSEDADELADARGSDHQHRRRHRHHHRLSTPAAEATAARRPRHRESDRDTRRGPGDAVFKDVAVSTDHGLID